MPLFTDGIICTIEDLAGQDSSVLDTASVEGLDLTGKLRLAQDEIGVELAPLLPYPGGLDNVAVTAPLRLWHSFRTLELVYRDAYHNQLNDRYLGKRDEYASLAKWASEKLMATGVGIVSEPVRKADPPELRAVGGASPAATYYVTLSWVNQRGEDGTPANWKAISIAEEQTFLVSALNPPPNAIGWNVYAGLEPEAMRLQNEIPLNPEQSWIQAEAVKTAGRQPGTGQAPDSFRRLSRMLQRG